ncbi:MAG TPA: DUF433 domain-containing protein [Bryobacteraceae bacterium]|nr:DUF433 domain-containing protein [Bryobacteraceae bacterium]
MANLSDFEKMLPALSRGEKAQILKWVVQELGDDFPGIDSRPDACGGEPCIVRTRIPVWLLEQARRLGTSEQALLAAYPSLRGGPGERLGIRTFSCRGNRVSDSRERGRIVNGPFLFERESSGAGGHGTAATGA